MARHKVRGKGRGAAGGAGAADDAALGEYLAELAAIAADPERRAQLDGDALLLVTFQQCLYYGHTQDPAIAAALAALYPELVAKTAGPERVELLDRVAAAVEEGGSPVLALLPFLLHEPEPEAVAVAAETFASLVPLEDGDELTGPRELLALLEHAEEEGTRVGLAAALLRFGDRRLRPLVDEAWRRLDAPARVRRAELRGAGNVLFAATVEFWLDALEDAPPDVFAAVTSLLGRMPHEADPPRVLDVRRKFPANAPDDRDEITILSDVPVADFAAVVGPRTQALVNRGHDLGRLVDASYPWRLEER